MKCRVTRCDDAEGRLLTTGVVDYDELGQAVKAGYERGKGSLEGCDPSR